MGRFGRPLWDDPNHVLGSIIPDAIGYDLGSVAMPFRNLYLSGSTVESGDFTIGANLIFSAASARVIPGITSLLFRNNANTQTNLSILDNGNVSVRGTFASTGAATLASLAVTAAATVGTTLGVTGVATLASNLVFSAASAKIIPGATSLLFRDTGDTNTNLSITDAGNVAVRGTLAVTGIATFSTNLISNGNILANAAGGTLSVKSGSNACAGTFVNNGTTPVVTNTNSMQAGSVVIVSLKTVGGTVGERPHVSTYTAGTSFTTVGTAADTSTYNWIILNVS